MIFIFIFVNFSRLSSSYQGRLSQASEYSLERSSASHRQANKNKSSPSQSCKYREQDMTGSHQHSQSSGYHSQLYENQTGNPQLPNTLENNYINLTGSKPYNRQYQGNVSDRPSHTVRSDSQYVSRHHESNRLKETDKLMKLNKQDEKFIKVNVKSEIPENRDASREVVSHNYTSPVSRDDDLSEKIPTCTPPKVANKPVFTSPQRHDGYVIQETTIEIINEGAEKNSNTLATCCEMSESALEAMRKAEKMLLQHSDTHKQEIHNKYSEQSKYGTHRDLRHGSDHQTEKGKLYGDLHKEDMKYDMHIEHTKSFSVAYKGNENQNQLSDTHKEQEKLIGGVLEEHRKPESDIDKEHVKSERAIHKDQGRHISDTHDAIGSVGQGKTRSNFQKRQEHFYNYTHKGPGETENTEAQREVNKGNDVNSGAKVNVEDKRKDVRVNLDDQFAEADNESQCDKEFEKRYTFENKLCSFLEDLDDIDDSIWDEKPVKSTNVSTVSIYTW